MKLENVSESHTGNRAGLLHGQPPQLRYGVALLLCAIAAGFCVSFPRFRAVALFSPFYLAVTLAAWFGGLRAGLLASTAAILMIDYFFLPPPGFTPDATSLTALSLAGFIMATISWLIDHRADTREWIEGQLTEGQNLMRRHQARLASAARIAGMGSWEYDITGDRLEWDDETMHIFGMTREAFGGNADAFFALVHPEDRETLRAMQVKARPTHGITEMEYRIVRPDGAVRRIHDRGQVTQHENGIAVQSTGMVMDITERKQAEQALQASEQRWRAIFENSAVGIALADENGFLTLTNQAYQKMVGYTNEEFRSMSYLDLTFEADRADNEELRRQLWQGTIPQFQQEKRYRCKDGQLIWVRNTVSIVPGTERTARFGMAIVEDITERHLLEERVRQSQRMEAVGRLAGGVAHDFNNMLGVILGHSSKLEETLPAGAPDWQRARQIRQAAARSADLTRQLLAFSRQQVLLPKVLDLNTTVSDLSSMLNSLSGDGIELVICPAEGLECVKADPGQIGQVVLNLVANARDAMPKGGKVVIETRNVTLDDPLAGGDFWLPAGKYVMLSVADNGCGMDPEIVGHIFEPFFTTKEQGQGTGLGLATVYGIVKQSEGFIAAESEPGKGSTFKIYLPQVQDGTKKMVAEPEEQDAVTGSETILLAEDEPLLREIIRMQLEDGGYTVLEAQGSREAMEVAASHTGNIDLLLTDVVMGGGTSGLELAASLHSGQPGLKILYMTGYTAEFIDQNGAANLQDRVLQKPFTSTRLKNKIREVLATR